MSLKEETRRLEAAAKAHPEYARWEKIARQMEGGRDEALQRDASLLDVLSSDSLTDLMPTKALGRARKRPSMRTPRRLYHAYHPNRIDERPGRWERKPPAALKTSDGKVDQYAAFCQWGWLTLGRDRPMLRDELTWTPTTCPWPPNKDTLDRLCRLVWIEPGDCRPDAMRMVDALQDDLYTIHLTQAGFDGIPQNYKRPGQPRKQRSAIKTTAWLYLGIINWVVVNHPERLLGEDHPRDWATIGRHDGARVRWEWLESQWGGLRSGNPCRMYQFVELAMWAETKIRSRLNQYRTIVRTMRLRHGGTSYVLSETKARGQLADGYPTEAPECRNFPFVWIDD